MENQIRVILQSDTTEEEKLEAFVALIESVRKDDFRKIKEAFDDRV